MPFYTVIHKDSLTPEQCDELAAAITEIHTGLFSAPSLFVNVKFENISAATPYYVGGKRRLTNAIHARVRPGPSRPRSSYETLCARLTDAWTRVVPSAALDRIFVMGSLIAGYEHGFFLPEAGKDAEWVREHLGEFRRRAEEGDEDMRELVEEVEGRGWGK